MTENKTLPLLNRLSIMLATVTLALGFTYILPTATEPTLTNFLGFMINVKFDAYSLVPVFIALLTFFGALWVFIDHPNVRNSKLKIWKLTSGVILPVFTTLVLSITLREMSRGSNWWVVYILGTFLFGLVVVAEYNELDVSQQHPFTTIGLIGLSHGLFLILTIVLRTSDLRLYLLLPIMVIASAFVSVRTIFLRLNGIEKNEYTVVICLIMVLLASALYYLFITPIQYGLLLTGALYATISFACGLINGFHKRDLLNEPLGMLAVTLVMALIAG